MVVVFNGYGDLKIPFMVVGGRGAETTVLLFNTFIACWRTGHRDHRPTMVCKAI